MKRYHPFIFFEDFNCSLIFLLICTPRGPLFSTNLKTQSMICKDIRIESSGRSSFESVTFEITEFVRFGFYV